MKTIFTSLYKINDISQWSGTIHFMSKNLEESGIDLLNTSDFIIPQESFYRAKSYLLKRFLNLLYFKEREPRILKEYAKYFHSKFSVYDYDNILSPQTAELAYIETRKPMAFWVDATFFALMEELKSQYNITLLGVELGTSCDKIAIEKASIAIYSSDWAAKSAIDFYNAPQEKVKVIPFGANIQNEFSYDEIKTVIQSRPHDVCRLLFIGIDWERKGGDLIVELMKKFKSINFNAELHIVGCNPKLKGSVPSNIFFHSFIDKNTKQGIELFNKLFLDSHFFIMLSFHEPYGLVYCESNSFGVPAIGTDVGGVSTIIKDNINGLLFTHPINLDHLANSIINVFQNKEEYQTLALSAYNEYKTRLNWKTSCRQVKEMLSNLQ